MNGTRGIALLIIGLGVLGLVYGGFTYTKSTDKAKIGPIEIAVKDKQHVNVPLWVGVGAIVVGSLMLVGAGKKS